MVFHLTQGLIAATLAALALGCVGCVSHAGPVLWHEAENFATATADAEKQTDARAPASGGRLLYGGNLDDKGAAVTWKLSLPMDIADAQVIFRYARLHWRDTMTPAQMSLEFTGGKGTSAHKMSFGDTRGWGRKPQDWGLAAVEVGALVKGKYTVKLTSLTDNNSISVDGFFIAPADFKITGEELSALRNVQITSTGYCGIRTAAIIRQDQDPSVWVAAESFVGPADAPEVTLHTPDGKKIALEVTGQASVAEVDLASWKYALPKMPDGDYEVEIDSATPRCELTATMTLAGDLLGSLDGRLDALQKFVDAAKDATNAATVICRTDVEHIIEYLKANAETLNTAAGGSAENPWKQGLAFHEGAASSSPVVANMARALAQAEAVVRQVGSGKAPYEGETGELRRSFLSAKNGQRHVYRLLVPSSYTKADKVPFILFLHGGGGDEDYWPDMADGAIVKMLEKRDYMAAMPKYHTKRMGPHWRDDLLQLVALLRKEYPKIDASRIYVTGISMGGFGTYRMVTSTPDLFAAGCCVSGTGKVELARKLKTVSLMIIHGGNDTVVRPAGAKAVAAEMEKLGYTAKLHIFPTYGHGYQPSEYLPLTLDWFDKYRKK
jgi:dienelactone hydrolase